MVTINSGVDISYGRVTKALEIIPSMARPSKISQIDAHTRVCCDLSNMRCSGTLGRCHTCMLLHFRSSDTPVHLQLHCKVWRVASIRSLCTCDLS